MTRPWFQYVLACLLTAGVLFTGGVVAADSHDDDRHAERRPVVRLSGVHDGKQFLAGTEVDVEAEVRGDVFAAAGEVRVRDSKVVDLFLAGGFVELSGVQAEDAILAGGEVDVGGRIAGDLIAAGGSLEVERAATVAGDALLAGGRLAVSGGIEGDLRAAAGQIRIDGPVGGDARLAAGRITLGPGAHVAGDLSYRSESAIEIAEGARVDGQVTRLAGRPFDAGMPGLAEVVLAGVLGWLGLVLGLIVVAVVLLAAFPRLLAGASDTITLRPWQSVALGLAMLVSVPVAAPLAMATVVGLPLGVMALLLYAACLAAGVVVAGLWIGQYLPKLRGRHATYAGYGRRLGRAAAGIVLLGLVALVPVLGMLVLIAALVVGFGGLMIQAWRLLGGEPAAAGAA